MSSLVQPAGRSWIGAAATAVATLTLWFSGALCRGELTVIENADDQQELTVFKMTVTPAAEPKPALKHRLTLREREYKPGNAVTHYMRAFPEGGFDQNWKAVRKENGEETFDGWYAVTTPLSEIPLDKLRLAAARFDTLVNSFLTPGSERLDSDWGHGIITELRGPDIYGFLLPEIQSMRGISRAIMLCTRAAIADRDYDRAINLLRMNYRLGENVAKSPFIVSGLVGLAICGVGNMEVVELIASPDSPNLYWALAELPRPLVNLRASIRHELSFNVAIFPFMESPETAQHSPEQWAQLLAQSFISMQQLSASGSAHPDPELARLAVTGLGILTYPAAKQRLVESGMTPADVEAMPIGQVLAIDAARQFRLVGDEMEKWWYVPFAQANQHESEFDQMTKGNSLTVGFGKVLARLILPALESARMAQERVDWQLEGLKTVEAIRMYAAEKGRLPRSLDEITLVPLPVNPATGKIYQYRLEGKTAIVDLPFSDGINSAAWRFEITLAK